MSRVIDLWLYIVYVNGLVMTAFAPDASARWTDWWRARRPTVVEMWERSPARRRQRK